MMLAALALITANPATLPAAIGRAAPGDTIRLQAGEYGRVTIKSRTWERPVTIVAGSARLNLSIFDTAGLVVKGGLYLNARGTGSAGYAIQVRESRNIHFSGLYVADSIRGIVLDRVKDMVVDNTTLHGMTIDGINIASSQRVAVRDSSCRYFVTAEAHPDCVQLWSNSQTGVTTDIIVERVTSVGNMQGITAFNHTRNGVDDGGFDRVVFRNNTVESLYPHGVAMYDCRKCIVSGNRTSRLPGARWKVGVNVYRSPGALRFDNQVGP